MGQRRTDGQPCRCIGTPPLGEYVGVQDAGGTRIREIAILWVALFGARAIVSKERRSMR